MMHQYKAIFSALWYLSFLFLSASLQASIEISDYRLLYATDKQAKTLMPTTHTITSDTTKVWLSAEIKDAPPETKVTIIWYYIRDYKLEKIYEKTTGGQGSATLESDLKWKDRETFISGRYRVDFYLGEKKVKSLYFTVSPLPPAQQTSTLECIKPTTTDDTLLIKDVLKNYPMMQKEFKALKLKRYHSKGDRFSLLLPTAWSREKSTASDSLLTLSTISKQHKESILTLREYSLDTIKEIAQINGTIVQTAIKLLVNNSLSLRGKTVSNSELIIPPKIIRLPDMTVGRYAVLHSKKKEKGREYRTVIYDGKYLYDFLLLTENEKPDFRGFLSALLVYSFWTKVSCK